MITKSGHAQWEGDLKTGEGHISTESQAIKDLPYGFNKRFEGDAGTNPEELIGAAHAACFCMASSKILGDAGITADYVTAESQVTLEQKDGGFAITKVHLVVKAKAEGQDEAKVKECLSNAKDGCPVSKLLNAEISIEMEITV